MPRAQGRVRPSETAGARSAARTRTRRRSCSSSLRGGGSGRRCGRSAPTVRCAPFRERETMLRLVLGTLYGDAAILPAKFDERLRRIAGAVNGGLTGDNFAPAYKLPAANL